MLYVEQREKLLEVLSELKTQDLIDCVGGALSMRCSDHHMIITTTGSAFKRWNIDRRDFIVLDWNGNIVESSERLGPSGTPVHLEIYKTFPESQSIVHTHSPYSLVFAALKMPVPSSINAMDTLGEIPCLYADDYTIKQEFKKNPVSLQVPEGMAQRPEVYAINTLHLIPQMKEKLLPRQAELSRHGLAFTVYKHGIYVFARSADEAFENLVRIETSARTHIFSQLVLGK